MRRFTLVPMLLLGLVLPSCVGRPGAAPAASPAAVPQVDIGSERRGGSIVGVVERVLPSVVNVTTDQVDALGGGGGQGTGTGFIVRSDGFIVTNYHVVENARRIRVFTSEKDPNVYEGRVVGGDDSADLAVLKVEADGLPTIPVGRSGDLQLGQRVVAIGYALALEGGPTVTTGIVSSLDRVIQAGDPSVGSRTYRDVIQTDAAINPGNSGGPLVDLRGQVVGINTAGAGQAENIGFAIAIDAAMPVIEGAIREPEAPAAYLGVVTETATPQVAIQTGLSVERGALVVDVSPNAPADRVGVNRGDVIVGFGGQPVDTTEELGRLITQREPGDRVEVELVIPSGQRRTVTATLGVRPLPVTPP